MLASGGQWVVILAHRIAPASLLAPFFYSQLLWVTVLGFLVFGNLPDTGRSSAPPSSSRSGLYTAHRERVAPPGTALAVAKPCQLYSECCRPKAPALGRSE